MPIETYKKFLDELTFLIGVESRRTKLNSRVHLFSIEFPVIKTLVFKHKSIIEKKVPGIDLDEVARSAHFIFKKAINANLPVKGIRWLDASQDEIIVSGTTNNFQKLQKFITRVKKSIVQEAFANIQKSKSVVKDFDELAEDSNFQLHRASLIPLIGADINPKSRGGDLNLSTDFKKGIFVGASRLSEKNSQSRGFHIGHTFGPGVANLAAFVGSDKDSETEISSLFDTDIRVKLSELRDEAVKIDANIDLDVRLFNKSGFKQGTLTVTVAEFGKENKATGTQLKEVIAKALKLVVEQKVRLATRYGASPSILQRLKKGIIELFLTGKITKKLISFRKKFKTSKTIKIPTPVYTPEFTSVKERIRPRSTEPGRSTQSIIDLINSQLHDQIQKNMGKGESKEILNYRTGRFARSAKVETLTASSQKGAMLSKVGYMMKPYDVFEKGGYLYKPLRDPKGIFGRSIRQILAENKIANLRRVIVETHDNR